MTNNKTKYGAIIFTIGALLGFVNTIAFYSFGAGVVSTILILKGEGKII